MIAAAPNCLKQHVLAGGKLSAHVADIHFDHVARRATVPHEIGECPQSDGLGIVPEEAVQHGELPDCHSDFVTRAPDAPRFPVDNDVADSDARASVERVCSASECADATVKAGSCRRERFVGAGYERSTYVVVIEGIDHHDLTRWGAASPALQLAMQLGNGGAIDADNVVATRDGDCRASCRR